MFPHLSTGSRPTRHRTRVFLGVREHDLPTFPVPIRIVVSTRFHLFPWPFGNVSTPFHTFEPVPASLATGLGLSGRPTTRLTDFPRTHPNRCFHTFPLVAARFDMIPHLSTGSRPTRHRTRVFWASVNTTYRLSRYPSESMFPHVSIGSCPFGHVSTALRTFPPLPGRLGPLRRRTQFWPFFVDYSTRFSGVRGDFASNHPNRCFLTFPLVPACFHMLRHHSTPFHRLTAHLGRFATGPSFGPFSPLSRCFDMFPLVPARFHTFPPVPSRLGPLHHRS